MGHLKRASLIADALKRDYRIKFVMKDYRDGVLLAKKQGWDVEVIPQADNTDSILIAICEDYKPAKVIFDLKETPYNTFFDYASASRIRTVVFDICGKCIGHPDVIINDSFVPQFLDYSISEVTTKIYTGPDYFVMDETSLVSSLKHSAQKVLLTMGGSDPAGLTVKTLNALLPEVDEYLLSVVLGPAFSDQEIVESLVDGYPHVELFVNPENFLYRLSKADIVITSAGRTLYECAYFGRPVIIIPSISHETITAREYARLTGCTDLGLWQDETSPDSLRQTLKELKENYNLRLEISKRSRMLVDGKGLERVMRLIARLS